MSEAATTAVPTVEEIDRVTIRFAGDSGDGMQLTGSQFTHTIALAGNDLSTLPDYPAEIRAPAGSLPGVSSFQICFSSQDIHTPGDEPDVLIAMNPAALKVHAKHLKPGGILLVNTDAFSKFNLTRAGYESNPLEDGSLSAFRLFKIPITTLNEKALQGLDMSKKEMDRCKNFYALGIMLWLYSRPLDPTLKWIEDKFQKKPQIAEANKRSLKGGNIFAESAELFTTHYRVQKAKLNPGTYRNITGNEATALGFVTAAELADCPLFYASYPITPASDVLHELARHKNFGVKTFQAEDEIAAVTVAIGASYAGCLGLTGTSSPGLCLKAEAIGLAISTELPLVIVDVQRAGPSTGMPTKTEQADLFLSLFGRHGESPVAVVAPSSPADCFTMAVESFRIATKHMTPVIYLSDGYLANGAEPWRIPTFDELPKMPVHFWQDSKSFHPFIRDENTLARPWAIPGTPGLEHRIGGLEKHDISGNVSYDPDNHEQMTHLRLEKIERIANDIPELNVLGKDSGKLLVVGWGGTKGSITSAVEELQKRGASISAIHLRYLNPFPKNLETLLRRFDRIIVPELNLGQLQFILRARFLLDIQGYHKVQGQPFKIKELVHRFEEELQK